MANTSDFLNAVSSQLGKQYVWGADSPQTGFDCSGLVYWAAAQAGAPIGVRTSESMYQTLPVTDSPGPGDLVFFDEGGDIGHVGICTNQGCTQMIDAPHAGAVIRSETIPPVGGQWGKGATVAGYRAIPGLSGDGVITANEIALPNPFGGSGVLGDVEGAILKPIAKMIGAIPETFTDILTGGKTLGEVFFRAMELTAGATITALGLVMFAVLIRRKGDGGLQSDYDQAVRSYRHIQHEQMVAEQNRRGEIRRRNAQLERVRKEQQHERGVQRRANAEARLLAQQAKKSTPKGSKPSQSRVERGARFPATSNSAGRMPSRSQVTRERAESKRVVHDYRDEMNQRMRERLGR